MKEPNFNQAPDADGLVFRKLAKINDSSSIVVGLWPTIFGMRVRSGWLNRSCYMIDWCCGDQDSTIKFGYSLCLAILNARLTLPPEEIFTGILLCSLIKPFPPDQEFLDITLKFEQKPTPNEDIPSFQELRQRYKELNQS